MEVDEQAANMSSASAGVMNASVSSPSTIVKPYGLSRGDIDRVACAKADSIFTQMLALERGQTIGGPATGPNGRRAPYNPEARYVKYRRLLVDWLSELGEDYRLANTTIHAAVELLDRFLQCMEVHKTRYQLVAMACFAIAAKFEEAEEHVPSSKDINEYAHNAYPPKLVHQMEIAVLMRLNWSVTSTTALHFLGYMHCKGLLWASDAALVKQQAAAAASGAGRQGMAMATEDSTPANGEASSSSANTTSTTMVSVSSSSSSSSPLGVSDTMAFKPLVPSVPKYLKKYTDFFADLALQDYSFQQYQPSLLAAAIALAARKSLVIRPLWNPALEELTGYSEQQVVPAMCHLWSHYCVQFPAESEAQEVAASEADKKALAAGKISLSNLPAYCSLWAQQAHHNAEAAAAQAAAVAVAAAAQSGALLGVSRSVVTNAPFTPFQASNANNTSHSRSADTSLHSASSHSSYGARSSASGGRGGVGSPDTPAFQAVAAAVAASASSAAPLVSGSSFSALLASAAAGNGAGMGTSSSALGVSGVSTGSADTLRNSGVSNAGGATGDAEEYSVERELLASSANAQANGGFDGYSSGLSTGVVAGGASNASSSTPMVSVQSSGITPAFNRAFGTSSSSGGVPQMMMPISPAELVGAPSSSSATTTETSSSSSSSAATAPVATTATATAAKARTQRRVMQQTSTTTSSSSSSASDKLSVADLEASPTAASAAAPAPQAAMQPLPLRELTRSQRNTASNIAAAAAAAAVAPASSSAVGGTVGPAKNTRSKVSASSAAAPAGTFTAASSGRR